METNTNYVGIDYGMGKSNINNETGIRFGVLPFHEISEAWCGDSEADYGDDTFCPYCGEVSFLIDDMDEADQDKVENYEYDGTAFEYACHICCKVFNAGDAMPDEPLCHSYESDGYKCYQFDDTDIFVELSPYFTYAQFCSPCAPGACYLKNPLDSKVESNKCYCFGHDWFESGKAPYNVYSVETGEIVKPE